jgi:(R)-2-hydroxyacyl-CoA dehydratese activating ATPase
MRSAGLDIGSRTVKLAVLEDGKVLLSRKALTSHDPLETVRRVIDGAGYGRIAATGYGRHLVKDHLGCPVISEISAFAIGAKALHPACRLILDIGGQDTKAIGLDQRGELIKFEMNDKCAAGTGRFLEVMAAALGYDLDGFSRAALSAERPAKINNMCTVFAESEVISLTAQGVPRQEVALGIHRAIVTRSVALLRRVAEPLEVFFAGGVALNDCVRALIAAELNRPVVVPPDPQIVGALGAALHAARYEVKRPVTFQRGPQLLRSQP